MNKLGSLAKKIDDRSSANQARNAAAEELERLVTEGDADILQSCVSSHTLLILNNYARGRGNRSRKERRRQVACIRALAVLGDIDSVPYIVEVLEITPNRRLRREALEAVRRLEAQGVIASSDIHRMLNAVEKRFKRRIGVIPLWLFGPITAVKEHVLWPVSWALSDSAEWMRNRWPWLDALCSSCAELFRDVLLPGVKCLVFTLASIAFPPIGVVYIAREQARRERLVEKGFIDYQWIEAGRPLNFGQRLVFVAFLLGCSGWSIVVWKYRTVSAAVVVLLSILVLSFLIWFYLEWMRKDRYIHGQSEYISRTVSTRTRLSLLLGRSCCWIGVHLWELSVSWACYEGIPPHNRTCKRCRKRQYAVLIEGVGLTYRDYSWPKRK